MEQQSAFDAAGQLLSNTYTYPFRGIFESRVRNDGISVETVPGPGEAERGRTQDEDVSIQASSLCEQLSPAA